MELFEQLIKSRLGTSYDQAEQLRKGYDRGAFNDLSQAETDSINASLKGTDELAQLGADNTTIGDKISGFTEDITTNIPTAFAKGIEPNFKKLFTITQEQNTISSNILKALSPIGLIAQYNMEAIGWLKQIYEDK